MNKEPIIRIYPDAKAMALEVSGALLQVLDQTIREREYFHIALSGGNTPRLVYEHLAASSQNTHSLWKNVHFFWGDERSVFSDHPESNYRMAHEAFLSRISIPLENIHRIKAEESPEVEARRYEKEIQDFVPSGSNGIPRFDLIFLGMGADGHIASLFPKAPILLERKRLCEVTEHPETGQIRISLTLPLINNAKQILFLVTGKEKARIVEHVLKEGSHESAIYPASMIEPTEGILEWHLDKEAAQLL